MIANHVRKEREVLWVLVSVKNVLKERILIWSQYAHANDALRELSTRRTVQSPYPLVRNVLKEPTASIAEMSAYHAELVNSNRTSVLRVVTPVLLVLSMTRLVQPLWHNA